MIFRVVCDDIQPEYGGNLVTNRLSGSQIFDVLLQDPDFTSEVPESAYEAFREFCETIPESLNDLLLASVSSQTFMEAKFVIIETLSAQLKRIFETYSDHLLLLRGGKMGSWLQRDFDKINPLLTYMIPGEPVPFLHGDRLGEEEFLVHENGGGFNEATLAKWREGTLTIEDLLLLQPMALLKLV